MSFISIKFVIFLPIVFLLYWNVFSKSGRLQNVFLLLASYIFYAFADYRYLALIAFTTACTYYTALQIERYKEQENAKMAKLMSAVNITVNLLVLGFFKYYNFFVSSFASLLPGVNTDTLMLNVVLPLGISYYTFSALSYSIDVYLGKTKASKDFFQVASYISFFPQLLAGPIGRSTYLLPQYSEKRVFNYEESVDGLRQILWGLFKKVVVADKCAVYVNKVWSDFSQYSSIELVTALMLFAFQVYGDFSGYSDIAIGVSKLFGIKLRQNFRCPLFSTNVADFWSRWHISLTSWLRDYIYAPLGGVWSKATIIRNIFIVFALCGLWHGAGWNYIVWGLYNALLFVPFVCSIKYRKKTNHNCIRAFSYKLYDIFKIIMFWVLLLLGLILIRADSIQNSIEYINSICVSGVAPNLFTMRYFSRIYKYVIVIAVMFFVEYINKNEEHGLSLNGVKLGFVRYCIYYLLLLVVIIYWEESQMFIYAGF